jgi:hypothetical protein
MRVGLGEDWDRPSTMLGLKAVRWARCSHKRDAGREMWPPVFDPSIQVLTGHFRHPQVTQNDIVAVTCEHFEGLAAVGHAVDIVPAHRSVYSSTSRVSGSSSTTKIR